MSANQYSGSCHCGNISFIFFSSQLLPGIAPRRCDCGFCIKHGASYVSDPNGKLTINANNEELLGSYQQGSNTASFGFCRCCGVLTHVTFDNSGISYGAINSKCLDDSSKLGEPVVVSPKLLSKSEKVRRWQDLWTADIKYGRNAR